MQCKTATQNKKSKANCSTTMEFLSHHKRKKAQQYAKYLQASQNRAIIQPVEVFNLLVQVSKSYLMVLPKIVFPYKLSPLFFNLLALTYSMTQLRCNKSLGSSSLTQPVYLTGCVPWPCGTGAGYNSSPSHGNSLMLQNLQTGRVGGFELMLAPGGLKQWSSGLSHLFSFSYNDVSSSHGCTENCINSNHMLTEAAICS